MLMCTKAEDHDRLNLILIGPPTYLQRKTWVDEQAGFVPPSWWKGDDYASQSGLFAMRTMRQ